MGTTLETLEQDGITIEIVTDEDPTSPRENDNLFTLLLSHRTYDLADDGAPVHILQTPAHPLEHVKRLESELGEPVLWFLVRGYDHSGLAMKAYAYGEQPDYPFNDQWDSGWLGIAYAPYSRIRSDQLRKRVTAKLKIHVRKVLDGEISEYTDYLNGSVYGYRLIDSDGNELDSCYGFYGYEYVLEEAKAAAKHHRPLQSA